MLKKMDGKHVLYQQGFDGNENEKWGESVWGILGANRKFSIKKAVLCIDLLDLPILTLSIFIFGT
jgi:hypothetical protein